MVEVLQEQVQLQRHQACWCVRAQVAYCMRRLEALRWHRVDVSFVGEPPWAAGGGPLNRIQGRGVSTPGGERTGREAPILL